MFRKIMQTIVPADKMIEMFTVSIISNKSIEEIVQKVPEACATNGFSLLQTYVYHDIVESKGFPIKRKVFIYEICRAKTAAIMLTNFPHFSIFMPCKLSVYEQDNKTVISTMDMEVMLKAVKANKELFLEANTLFNTLKSMMNQLSE